MNCLSNYIARGEYIILSDLFIDCNLNYKEWDLSSENYLSGEQNESFIRSGWFILFFFELLSGSWRLIAVLAVAESSGFNQPHSVSHSDPAITQKPPQSESHDRDSYRDELRQRGVYIAQRQALFKQHLHTLDEKVSHLQTTISRLLNNCIDQNCRLYDLIKRLRTEIVVLKRIDETSTERFEKAKRRLVLAIEFEELLDIVEKSVIGVVWSDSLIYTQSQREERRVKD